MVRKVPLMGVGAGSLVPTDLRSMTNDAYDLHAPGTFTARWTDGFDKKLFRGRPTAFYLSEAVSKVDFDHYSTPPIALNDNGLEPAGFSNALRVRNSIDGVAVDPLYVGFPLSGHKTRLCFHANLPSPAKQPFMGIGFEAPSGGAGEGGAFLWIVGGTWAIQIQGKGNSANANFALNNPDVYALYELEVGPGYMELYEAAAGFPGVEPVALTHTVTLDDFEGVMQPFAFNEDTGVLGEYRLGKIVSYVLDSHARPMTPANYALAMAAANTEYSQALPRGTRKLSFATRDRAAFRYAWVTGKVAGPVDPYVTVSAGEIVSEDEVNLNGKTLYVAAPAAGKTMEIEAWR